MKGIGKTQVSLLFAGLLLAISTTSQGATLTYTPTSMEITVAAGAEGTIPYRVTVQNGRGSYFLWFVNSVGGGNLPLGWLSPSPSTTFLNSITPSASTMLRIRVPAGTAPGVYTGTLLSRAMAAHSIADPGQGILIRVTVPSGCDQSPAFENIVFGPDTLWPPNHKMMEIVISGRVTLQPGCTLMEMGYSLDDEYGIYTAVGYLTAASDGSFTAYIPVEASRYGNDMDGRHYTLTLFAQDEAGIGSSPGFVVLVPHDQRSK